MTLEIVNEARKTMMGHSDLPPSELNRGTGDRQTMHLTDEYRFLARVSGDPLHDAFDRKLAVHAMARNAAIATEKLPATWDAAMAEALPRVPPAGCVYPHPILPDPMSLLRLLSESGFRERDASIR